MIRVWRVETGEPLLTFAGHEGAVLSLSVGSDGQIAFDRIGRWHNARAEDRCPIGSLGAAHSAIGARRDHQGRVDPRRAIRVGGYLGRNRRDREHCVRKIAAHDEGARKSSQLCCDGIRQQLRSERLARQNHPALEHLRPASHRA
jgi:hypothetical protein